MIKGVNKQVLEITEPQNGYFEKAIFFVKPEYNGFSEGKLRESAKKEMEITEKPPRGKVFAAKNSLKFALCLCGAFAVGILVGTLFF